MGKYHIKTPQFHLGQIETLNFNKDHLRLFAREMTKLPPPLIQNYPHPHQNPHPPPLCVYTYDI